MRRGKICHSMELIPLSGLPHLALRPIVYLTLSPHDAVNCTVGDIELGLPGSRGRLPRTAGRKSALVPSHDAHIGRRC